MANAGLKPEQIVARSEAHIDEYLFRGGPDTEAEDIELGEKFGVAEAVRSAWANAKAAQAEMQSGWLQHPRVVEEKSKNFLPGAQPPVADAVKVPKPKPQPKPAPEEEPKKAAIQFNRRYGWAEVVVPEGVGEIEALTYVPGLVGQIVDWIVAGARRPNRVMALGIALAVVGTLMGRRFEGPTGNATHVYIFILAPTGWGKDYPLWCGNKLMIAVGAQKLLGPSEFVSGRGIIKFLKRNPLTLCIVDELGDVFQLINSQKDNAWVRDLIGHFKKLYNSWEIVITAESMKDESVVINHPAVSIIGACTAQAFFEALKPADVEGGFANRVMLLPFEGIKRPPERDVPDGADEPPKSLVAELKQLWGDMLDRPSDQVINKAEGEIAPPIASNHRKKIGFGGREAKDAYFEFSREVDRWQDRDKSKFELGIRGTENAVRCATIVAGGCFSGTVDHPDMEWALRWSRVSCEAAEGGVKKYMNDYYVFPRFCERVAEFIGQQRDEFATERDLTRSFRRHMKQGYELDRATAQLVKEGIIERASRRGERGPAAEGWRIRHDAESGR
jgi:hypothetical protein